MNNSYNPNKNIFRINSKPDINVPNFDFPSDSFIQSPPKMQVLKMQPAQMQPAQIEPAQMQPNYNNQNSTYSTISTIIFAILTLLVIIVLCLLIYNLYIDNYKLKLNLPDNKDINLTCPECPNCPSCPECPSLPEIPKCPDPPNCPTTQELLSTMIPGRSASLADGTFVSLDDFSYEDNTINKGLFNHEKDIKENNHKYLINKQSLEMDKIKDKLQQIGDGSGTNLF